MKDAEVLVGGYVVARVRGEPVLWVYATRSEAAGAGAAAFRRALAEADAEERRT